MQRTVPLLAITLGFTGIVALAQGLSPSQPVGRPGDNPGALWITLPSNPSHTSFGTLLPDGTYRGVVSPDEDSASDAVSPAVDRSQTPFGKLMPDGTYCGVGCPSWDATP
jgi:hypothetical protein